MASDRNAMTSNEHWRGPLAVLLTATTPEPLLPFLDLAALPHFAAGPDWTVLEAASIGDVERFDFAIALCAQPTQIAASVALVQRLRDRGGTALLLVPATLESLLPGNDEPLIVVGPNDLEQGVRALGDTLLAGVQQDGLVGCDWADIANTLNDGARGLLLWAAAVTAAEAVDGLTRRMAPWATGLGYGAIGALTINATGRLHDWFALLHALATTARAEAWSIGSAPYQEDVRTLATALVLTAPSTRYVRNVAGAEAVVQTSGNGSR